MPSYKAYGVHSAQEKLAPLTIERRSVGKNDILIEIEYCGICHSDIHVVRNEWKSSMYPVVPGHEIVGIVKKIGSNVSRFTEGDIAGVGCMVDSCMKCTSCKKGLEQYCDKDFISTYNSKEYKSGNVTYGGYSTHIVVREEFVFKIPKNLDHAAAAPLLCAGITTYSPLNHWKVGPQHKVGVVGVGGLGHMAVKLAHAMGAHVVVFTTSKDKVKEAKRLGAKEVVYSKSIEDIDKQKNKLDYIINTLSVVHDLNTYLQCLKRDGVMVMLGLPEQAYPSLNINELIWYRKSLAGSLIGGVKETQKMLNFCGKHNIVCDIELINIQEVNLAYERMLKGDVKYRFVIDMKSLNQLI